MDLEKIKAIFTEAAMVHSAQERAAYLAVTCGPDQSLRDYVESLLTAQKDLGDFLEPSAPREHVDAWGIIGTTIGPYKLLEQVGEGGFGIVYMAEQERPVRRKVALKIIKAGMDSKQVIARFEAERQALAMMDHPNIAQVFDAGETAAGRSYFAMELVKGVSLIEFCNQKKLTTQDRLNLFIKVCDAVQHAHQKGIIHRDLKPSNVMITIVDGQPVPKVIDFGVAKAIGQRLTEKTLFTRYDQLIGTPAYMSPEQAELSGVDVDTRSDIYSLGVLLYELLTGTPPIDPETLRKSGLDEIRRLIRETDPPKPSTRLQSMGEKLTTVASNLQIEPAALCKSVRGDLDWVVMKCLEKERARRYQNVSNLRSDLQCHLNQQPVTARPPAKLYRFGKFARRNRLAVAFAVSATGLLVLGLISALVGFSQTRRERDRALKAEKQAKDQQQLARKEAVRSEQVANFLKDMLGGASPAISQGRDTTILREIVDRTAARLDKELSEQPEVEADLRSVLGQIYRDLDDFTNAAVMYEKALELRQEALGGDHLDVAVSLGNLADFRQRERKYAEAERMFRQALSIRQKLLGNKHPLVIRTLIRLGSVLMDREGKDSDEGKMMLSRAENMLREMLQASRGTSDKERRDKLWILERLSFVLICRRNYPEAETFLREGLALKKQQQDVANTSLGGWVFDLAHVLRAQNKLEEAETVCREALAHRRKVFGDLHSSTAQSLAQLATLLEAQGKLSEAEGVIREMSAIQETVAPGGWRTFTMRSRLGDILLKQMKYEEAEPLLLGAYESIVQQRDLAPHNFEEYHATALRRLAKLYEETGRAKQATELKQRLAELDQSKTQN